MSILMEIMDLVPINSKNKLNLIFKCELIKLSGFLALHQNLR